MDLYATFVDLATNPKHSRWLSPLLLAIDACLCALVIWKVPYTEIDWETYMQQVKQYLDGERDYTLIKGSTGPLVYPAAHVYIYSLLYKFTAGGKNILLAQTIFSWLYLGTLTLVMACYKMSKAPPYLFPLLILSKRLHSIFLLRLFNDCFAVAFLYVAIYAFQHRIWTVGSVAFSFGVGTKMSLLLASPAVGTILLQALPLKTALNAVFLMAQVQITIAWPFIPVNPYGYFLRAFEFSRQFLYRWTVNWKFFDEQIFLSREFASALALLNVALLALFIRSRWLRPSGLYLTGFIKALARPSSASVQQRISLRVTPSFVMTSILSSMVVGLLCARSLHYQFYSYISWSTPFLLWRSGLHPVLIYVLWAVQEWAWNTYPSTASSSSVVFGCLLLQVYAIWRGTRNDLIDDSPSFKKLDKKNYHAN